MLADIYNTKRAYFDRGNTRSLDFRMGMLDRLRDSIKRNEEGIVEALAEDLGKPEFEIYTAEIGIIYQEISNIKKNLKKWMKPQRVATPIYLQPSSSYIYSEPKGVVMIFSPWNYPFQLAMSPLAGAIAAGNCVVLKPSNKSANTQRVIAKIIKEAFEPEFVSVIEGPGYEEVDSLIENLRFDHIFFTGGVAAGRKIMGLASKQLTPVTLELGGKSPVIVHRDANVDIAAKNIVWTKFFNAGQTCIAPDYLLVHESQKESLIKSIMLYINRFYGDDPEKSSFFGRIINSDRFERLKELMECGEIVAGGEHNSKSRFICPTIIDGVNMEDQIMKEEIFGPILPVLAYEDISEVVETVRMIPYPLALYLFTNEAAIQDYVLENIQFGGGAINSIMSHIINYNLPFGGVGYSGMGRYHSRHSFETFSHEKSIFKANGRFEPDLKYPPYSDKKIGIIKRFLGF